MKRLFDNSGRGASVRLGLTGSGDLPNYQVEHEGKPTLLFRGRSHKTWTGNMDGFAPENLSQAFAFADLSAAFIRHFREPRRTPPQKP